MFRLHNLDTKMSTAHLQSYFATRTGRDILPENLPIDVLISLAKELAFLDDGKLQHAEILQLRACLCDLLVQLLSMQPVRRLQRFRESENELLPALLTELNKTVRNELVSRLIEHRSCKVDLEEAFEEHFLEESAAM